MSEEVKKPVEEATEEVTQEPVTKNEEVGNVNAPETEATEQEKAEATGPGKRYEFADVLFHCGHCGHKNKLAEGLRGISYTVPAAENAEVSMECQECGTKLRLYFEESSEEIKAARRAEMAEMAETEKTQNDGSSKEDTEKEAGPGSVEDTERASDPNEEGDDAGVTPDGDGSELASKN